MNISILRNGLLAASLVVGPAIADTYVTAPAGALVDPHFAAGAPGAVAVALVYPASSTCSVLQWRGTNQVLTPVPGRILGIEYSHSGAYMLVTHVATPSQGDHPDSSVALFNAASGLLIASWPSSGKRFHFTHDGSAVYAVAGLDGSGHATPGLIETFALSGQPIMRHDWGVALPTGVVALGAGSQLVSVLGSDLVCSDNAGNIAWRSRMSSNDRPPVDLKSFSASYLLLQQDYGWFSLVTPSGVTAYRYNPEHLASAHPPTTWEQFAQYEPHVVSATKVGLFDGTSSAFLLDTQSWTMAPWQLNASVPPGFTLVRGLPGGQIVLIGPTSFIVRSIAVP